MAAIVVLGIPREQLSHDGRDAMFAALEKQMNVVIHEDPGVNGTLSFGYVLSEPFEEARLVLSVIEYVSLVDSPDHDVMQGSGDVQSCLAWHEAIV